MEWERQKKSQNQNIKASIAIYIAKESYGLDIIVIYVHSKFWGRQISEPMLYISTQDRKT